VSPKNAAPLIRSAAKRGDAGGAHAIFERARNRSKPGYEFDVQVYRDLFDSSLAAGL